MSSINSAAKDKSEDTCAVGSLVADIIGIVGYYQGTKHKTYINYYRRVEILSLLGNTFRILTGTVPNNCTAPATIVLHGLYGDSLLMYQINSRSHGARGEFVADHSRVSQGLPLQRRVIANRGFFSFLLILTRFLSFHIRRSS